MQFFAVRATIYLKIVLNRYGGLEFLSMQRKLEALSNPVSRAIMTLLKDGKLSAGEIAKALKMTPAATSYHLSKLKKADLLYESRYKNFIYYELNLSILDELVVWLTSLKGDSSG